LTLFGPRALLERRIADIVEEGRRARGHIFNLGHGIVPETDPNQVTWVTERVHELGRRAS
jgi:uroporphyrinogen decarboxylase